MNKQARILAVDDSATQLLQIRFVLESGGYQVLEAQDGEQALRMVQSEQPDLVVTDLLMPRMDGLELVRAISREQLEVPVILTTGAGSEMIAAEALHAGAASYVPKSGLSSILLPTVKRILELQKAVRSKQQLCGCVRSMTIEWKLSNDESLLPALIARVEAILQELGIRDPGHHMQVAMALDEAFVNAMVHGNLEVSSDLRRIDDGRPYIEKIQERLKTPPFCDRQVYFRLEADRNTATFTIRDEGSGFAVEEVPDPTDPANLDKEGGRGLLLISTFMDEVIHNKPGNEIRMTKRCSPSPPPSVPGGGWAD